MIFYSEHLAALPVILPLLVAPIIFITPSWKISRLITYGALAFHLLFSAQLFVTVYNFGAISYDMGGWNAPIGISYHVDMLAATMCLLISIVAFISFIYGWTILPKELSFLVEKNEQKRRNYSINLFYSLYLLLIAGLIGICLTSDLFNIFVFIEISSLAGYALIAMGRRKGALLSAFRYLIIGTLAASIYLVGVGIIYIKTGSLGMADVSELLLLLPDSIAIKAALAFMFVGLMAKMALFPLHGWLPSAYSEAPQMISVFLSAAGIKVVIYVVIRLLYDFFPEQLVQDTSVLHIIYYLSLAAMIYGSIAAIYQSNVKRIFAFSSIAQIGYICLGVALFTPLALSAGIAHIINHAIIKSLLFMISGLIIYKYSLEKLDLNNINTKQRKSIFALGVIWIIAGFSIIGVPLTAGFISKWYLLLSVWQSQAYLALIVMAIASLLAVIYMGKIFMKVFWDNEQDEVSRAEKPKLLTYNNDNNKSQPVSSDNKGDGRVTLPAIYDHKAQITNEGVRATPISAYFAIATMSFLCIYLGVNTEFSADLAQYIAQEIR